MSPERLAVVLVALAGAAIAAVSLVLWAAEVLAAWWRCRRGRHLWRLDYWQARGGRVRERWTCTACSAVEVRYR